MKYKRVLLFNNPIAPRICPELACEIGLTESLLLLQIDYWISISDNERDGMLWTYQSVRDIQQKAFPFLSVATISRALNNLIEKGYLIVGNYNDKKYDKTRWFALNYYKLKELKSIRVDDEGSGVFQNETRSFQNETRKLQNETTIPEITTDTTTEITKERKEYKEKKESRKSNDLLFTVEEKKKADKELEMFNAFWKAYPKKQKRAVALKCWQKLKVDEELFTEIMAGLDRLKQSRQWREQDGKFIPMPSTFLNERRWEDEPEVDKQALVQKSNVLEEQRVKKNYELTPEHPPFHDDIGNTLKWMELVKEWEAKYGMTFQEWEDKNGPLREYMRKHYGRG